MKKITQWATPTAMVLTIIGNVYGQEVATEPAPEAEETENFFYDSVPEWIKSGKVNINANLRWENVDQDGVDEANAVTLRTRLGYTTGSLYGFKGMLEVENNVALEDDYSMPGQAVVADPEETEINRAWISYENWDSNFKLGRQRMILDNARFVGNVGWRQMEQTFDAFSAKTTIIPDVTLTYGYIWGVQNIFSTEFDSDSHIINAAYKPVDYFSITGYAYLLDFEDTGLAGRSNNTFGGFVSGKVPIGDSGFTLGYRAEYAFQSDTGDNPTDYDADYYHIVVDGAYDRYSFGVGYEVLGSDDGTKGFDTPLATAHAFNGWADVFLGTPAAGLTDLYAFGGVTLPQQIPLKVIYHQYESDESNLDYGWELDAVVSKKFGDNWSVLAKYAYYSGGDDGFADRSKFWLQGSFNY